MPNLVAYGIAVPAFALVASTLRHRDRIPLAVLALTGVFSVHITGGVVTVLLVGAWWLFDVLWRPVRGRVPDVVTLLVVAVPTLLILLPQFLGVLQQADIIVGHAFVNHLGKKRSLFAAIVQHTRHLNDFPIQYALIALAAAGGLIMLIKKMWWPLLVWLLLIVSIVHSGCAVRRADRRDHREVQRPVLQRPAPVVGRGHDALRDDGRDRVGRARDIGDGPAQTPHHARELGSRGRRRRAAGHHGRPRVALLSATQVPVR